MYSESSTMPTALTDPHHLPIRPFIDYTLLNLCKKHDIPIGLFYRDIYWLFPEYDKTMPKWKAIFAKLFFRYDLLKYSKYVSKIYLPTMAMSNYIPIINPAAFDVLEPAHNGLIEHTDRTISDSKLVLFYVGGTGPHYQMHELFISLKNLPEIRMILCTREKDWLKVKDQYFSDKMGLAENISIVHKTGKEMERYFNICDIAMLYIKPYEYWKFALPLKLFEYIGHGKPIITSKGTYAAEYIEKNNLGWTIEYDEKALVELLLRLKENPHLIQEKSVRVKEFARNQTWTDRARKVMIDLKKKQNA